MVKEGGRAGDHKIEESPIFAVGTLGENLHFSDANYSIKDNSKVLIEDILDVDMCLRIHNLK